MKQLICIILFLSLLFVINGCVTTQPETNIRYFNSYVDCECPDMPQFSPITKSNHVGSVEKQEDITKRVNSIVTYSVDAQSCIKCFKKQVKDKETK